jgi:hypothetical protein
MNVWTLLGAFALVGAAALFYVGLTRRLSNPSYSPKEPSSSSLVCAA